MKVLHAISSGGMYGAEAVVLALCRAQNQQEPGSAALAVFHNSSNPNLALHEAAQQAGIESHLVPASGRVDTRTPALLRKLAGRTGADILHAHGYKADVYSYFAARGTDVRLVSTCHLWADADLPARLYGWVDRRVLRYFTAVVAVSVPIRERLLRSGVPAGLIHTVRNGIDVSPFQTTGRKNRQPLTVGFAARLSPEKGADLFLQVAEAVLAQEPHTRFQLAGDGPERAALEESIRAKHLQDHVELLGRREDMPEVYRGFDVLLMPSRNEGLPIALIEAMASALPVVATAVGDIPTLVEDGVTGLLVQPEDVATMTALTLRLLRSAEERITLGHAAAGRVAREFSDEQMLQAYLAVYAEVLRGQTAPSRSAHAGAAA